ncbi:hypothetical protein QTP88_017787 [Uroleucon formosanum]
MEYVSSGIWIDRVILCATAKSPWNLSVRRHATTVMGPEILISSANESRDQHGNNMTTPTTVLFLSIFFYASSSDCYMETFSQPVDILWVWVKANDERVGDINRALNFDQKARDLTSQNGSSEGHSPVLNLSKTGGDHSGPASDHSAGGNTNVDDEDDLDEDDDNISDGEEDDIKDHDLSDNPDVGGNSSAHGSVTPPPQALNFGSAGSGDMGLPYMTTESLLRKIQALLKAAADKIRDDDRALNFEKVVYQKRLRRERKARKRVQDQLEQELKRRAQLEEMIKAAGAPADALRVLTENNNEKPRDRSEQSQSPQNYSSGQVQRGSETSNDKQWNYSGLDLMSSSGAAAFWQNYSETFAQELDLERKARQQQSAQQNQQQSQHSDRDIKSPVPAAYQSDIIIRNGHLDCTDDDGWCHYVLLKNKIKAILLDITLRRPSPHHRFREQTTPIRHVLLCTSRGDRIRQALRIKTIFFIDPAVPLLVPVYIQYGSDGVGSMSNNT